MPFEDNLISESKRIPARLSFVMWSPCIDAVRGQGEYKKQKNTGQLHGIGSRNSSKTKNQSAKGSHVAKCQMSTPRSCLRTEALAKWRAALEQAPRHSNHKNDVNSPD